MKTAIVSAIVVTVLGLFFATFVARGVANMVHDANDTTQTTLENALR